MDFGRQRIVFIRLLFSRGSFFRSKSSRGQGSSRALHTCGIAYDEGDADGFRVGQAFVVEAVLAPEMAVVAGMCHLPMKAVS